MHQTSSRKVSSSRASSFACSNSSSFLFSSRSKIWSRMSSSCSRADFFSGSRGGGTLLTVVIEVSLHCLGDGLHQCGHGGLEVLALLALLGDDCLHHVHIGHGLERGLDD